MLITLQPAGTQREGPRSMDIGVFLPIGNNGWLISTTSPQYMPTFELNRDVTLLAEKYGFEFVLSMIKLRGFGGPSEYWDHNLESFTLMAGLASITTRVKLFASVAVLTVPPALLARMAVTIDAIAPGRFGVNIVSGWQKAEYEQMNIWPGEAHFARRYDYCGEYVQVLRDLWATGRSDFKGDFFQMTDCRVSPTPRGGKIEVISAGQSNRGMQFAAEYAEMNFISAGGINDISKVRPHTERLLAANAAAGAGCQAVLLMMIIADETDEAAMAKWHHYVEGTDLEALAWRDSQAAADVKAEAHSTVGRMVTSDRVPTNMLRLIGSYETIARQLDALSETPGLRGVMLTFDDYLIGMEQFGTRIQPLMKCRAGRLAQAA